MLGEAGARPIETLAVRDRVLATDVATGARACEEIVGLPCRNFFTPEDVQEAIPEYELLVASTSSDMNNDRWMQRLDGSRF